MGFRISSAAEAARREQVLSIRPDVLPPPVMAELAKLQDGIAPFPTAEARRVLEAELGRRVDDVFSEFAERPIAAASLAQVCISSYRTGACPRPGCSVVVYVQGALHECLPHTV